jgi:phosphomevalonate kinase
MNVDVEIYIKNFINFFESNPNDLIELIGDELKEVFYEKVKEQCYKNLEVGEDIVLTQKQLIDIVVDIKKGKPDINVLLTNGVFQKTKYGLISLN